MNNSLADIATIVIAMHIPIVFILTLLSWNAFKVLKESYFEFVFYAWLFNFFHVIVSFVHRLSAKDLDNYFYYPTIFFDLLNSYLFWLGATSKSSDLGDKWVVRFFPKKQGLVMFFVLIVLLIDVFSHWLQFDWTIVRFDKFTLKLPSLIMSLISAYFICRLSFRYKEKNEHGYRLLYWGTFGYGLLQIISIIDPEDNTLLVHGHLLAGYFFSLVFKALMLSGMYRIFLDDAKRRSEIEQINIGLNKILGRTYHEITTPLKTIQKRLSELTDEKDETIIRVNKKAQEKIDTIEANYNRLIAVVTASMKMYEAGIGTNFDPEIFQIPQSGKSGINNVNTVTEIAIISVKDLLKGENKKGFDEEGVVFNREYGKHCNIFCFQTDITQVIINILVNSIESFTNRKGSIFIRTKRITQESEDQTVKFVRVEIADNGPGIDKDLQELIFQEGFSTKPGIFRGYGMHLIKTIVEKNKGIIEIKSPYDFGQFNANTTSGTLVTLIFPSFTR